MTSVTGGAAGYLLGDTFGHSTTSAGIHIVAGAVVHTATYGLVVPYGGLVNSEVNKLVWLLTPFRPKGVKQRRLNSAMDFIDFLCRNPSQVAEFWWTITTYQKGNPEFRRRFRRLMKRLYIKIAVAKSEGALVRIAGIKAAEDTMSMIHNVANAAGGTGVMELFKVSSRKAAQHYPAMYIRMRNGETYAFDELMFDEVLGDVTRFGSDARHVARVRKTMNELMLPRRRFDPTPDLFPPQEATISQSA